MVKSKSFQKNLLFSIGGIFVLFAICFSVYQYQREKEYKIDILHSRLQMYNYEMMQTLGDSGLHDAGAFHDYVEGHNVEGLRVTVINAHGRVLLDSSEENVDSLGNHLLRTEIQQALIDGNGYDIKRTSTSTHATYFYSATRFGDVIVRAAVPYSAELTRSLQADNTYIYFAVALTFLMGIVLFLNTQRLGRHSEEEKVRIKRQLTQNVAHELKTPAASIHGYLESIIDNPDMPEDKRLHFLERCYAQSERMNKLLSDMSALTKLDEIPNHRPASEYVTVIDVVPIINNVLEDTALQLQEGGIEVETDMPSTVLIKSPLTEGDGVSAIYSIFRNLVDNAIAYATNANKIRIVFREGMFVFSDNGIGVAQEHLERLFERFYRIDKGRSRKCGGTGLGLAIVKNAVAAYGGTVRAEETPGGGLTIRFSLQK